MSTTNEETSSAQCQRANWEGFIPISLTIAPTSLSSPTKPPPLYRMISRQTYLHVGLEDDIRLLYKFAPSMNFRSLSGLQIASSDDAEGNNDDETADNKSSKCPTGEKNDDTEEETQNNKPPNSNDEPYPICWFEDIETGTPLRWQLFVGVLYDLMRLQNLGQLDKKTMMNSHNSSFVNNSQYLPWKIRVHFTAYPTSLLPFHPSLSTDSSAKQEKDNGVIKTISQNYFNSLKTALYIQHNTNRISRGNMTKQSDLNLWDSIVRNDWGLYRSVCQGFDGVNKSNKNEDGDNEVRNLQNVPIRILVNGKPAMMKPCPPYDDIEKTKDNTEEATESNEQPHKKLITVENILREWLPHVFSSVDISVGQDGKESSLSESLPNCQWCIQGIQVPLNSSIAKLWRALSHPDRFLYIIVVTKDE